MSIQRYTGENVEFHTTGDLVAYEDYAELKEEYERLDKSHSAALAKIDNLAAENAALKAAFAPKEIPTEATDVFSDTAILKIDGDEFHSSQWVDNETDVIRAVLDFFKPETPATDAILASLRAEVLPDNIADIIDSGDLEAICWHSNHASSEQFRMALYNFRQLRSKSEVQS